MTLLRSRVGASEIDPRTPVKTFRPSLGEHSAEMPPADHAQSDSLKARVRRT